MKNHWVLLVVLLVHVLIGCGPRTIDTTALPMQGKAADQPVSPAPEEATDVLILPAHILPEDEVISETQTQLPLDDETTKNVDLAKQDLSQRLGVSVDLIMVNAVIGQEFSTDAFYCQGKKDRIAKDESPIVMSGWVILLGVSERRYEYHASSETVIFCRPLP